MSQLEIIGLGSSKSLVAFGRQPRAQLKQPACVYLLVGLGGFFVLLACRAYYIEPTVLSISPTQCNSRTDCNHLAALGTITRFHC